jgi:glycosyltransferase involved in cell wall biosynthesis
MRIGIDAHFVSRSPRRGIGTYSLNLIRAMVATRPDIDFYLYIRHPDLEGALPIGPNVHVRQLTAPLYPLWEQVALPLAAYRDGVDLLHSLGNTGPLFLIGNIRQILTIHDVMFLQTGIFVPKPVNLYQKIGRWYRALITPLCARGAYEIITVSEFSKRDILSLIPVVDPKYVTVTYEGCDPIFYENASDSSPSFVVFEKTDSFKPFIFCLGADDPRKNTLTIVIAYLKLLREKNISEKLVIAGYKNWENSLAYKEVIKAGATDKVKFLSFVPLPELLSLYHHATLFAYPSLYEGFGIPILEAFNTGCPVVASGTTSIPEVGGDAALYIDPESVDELATAMFRLISDTDLRESMSSLGRARAAQFGWDRVANQTIDVYQHCLARN